MNIKMLLSGIALAVASQTVIADGLNGVYAGISSGSNKFTAKQDGDKESLNKTEVRLFVGKSINENLAIEGGYARLAKIEDTSFNSIFVDGLYKLPLGQYGVNGLTPFVKAGLGYVKASNGGGDVTKPRYGVGAMYDVQQNITARIDYTHNFKDSDDYSSLTSRSITAGIQYNY